MSDTGVRIAIDGLGRSFPEGGRRHDVLDRLALGVEPGDSLALLGRSGSGKSTLLNLISGIDAPDRGSIVLDAIEINALTERERTLYRRRHIGFVYQFFNLIPTLSVAENIALPLSLNGARRAQADERIASLLEAIGMQARADSFPDVLSGGEQQRVAIARAIAHRPRLLLADEPTGNLDDDTARQVLRMLHALGEESGCTLLIATHSREVAAAARRRLVLRAGRLEAPPEGSR